MPDDRHPLPGPTRRSRHGFPVLQRLDPDRAIAAHRAARGDPHDPRSWERGDRDSRVGEPSPFSHDRRESPYEEPPEEPRVHRLAAEWWEVPYKGGPMVKVAGFPRVLTPAGHPKGQSKPGPDVEAYKRTICRLGRWEPWQSDGWSDDYIKDFAMGRGTGKVGDSGVRGVQRQQGMPQDGVVGEATFNLLRSARIPEAPGFTHGGDMAMDSVAVNLIDEAYQQFNKPPPDVDDVRRAIADFCVRSIKAATKWHYVQLRPMQYGVPPDQVHPNDDCSEHATQSYYWSRKVTGIAVPDPNHSGFNGYGWTGTLINNPTASKPYKVGDLGLYGDSPGDTSHVVTCYQAGDASSSEWCSNGSEDAPYAVELHYRSDFLTVVRPKLTP